MLRHLSVSSRNAISLISLLHVAGFGLFLLALSQAGPAGAAIGAGAAATAYTLGARHAFDADHIAAIDTVTRHLRSRGGSPTTVGMWFSLGHSTIVLLACVLLAAGMHGLAAQMTGAQSGAWMEFTGIWGPTVSALFLVVLAVLNGVVLRGLLNAGGDQAASAAALSRRGLMHRLLGNRLALVTRPRHMYVVGFVFGLGFDTATSVGLLLVAGGTIAGALPWYGFVGLPLIFAAGMSLCDTLDGAAMNYAYQRAESGRRLLAYNVAVTAIGIVAALLIATVNLSGVATELGWDGPAAVANLNLDLLGFGLVATFAALWGAAWVRSRRPAAAS